MTTKTRTTDTPVTLRLSEVARAKLCEQAAASGKDLSDVASDLIEQIVSRPSVAEIMGPVHKQFSESGMSDQELEAFLRAEVAAHRREVKGKTD
jgi:hypothetical protein